MENKPQNVFEKLDKQGEQVEDISMKLEGVSVNDLYGLAKRTWEYGDYQTAQKYYNHISLLRPLDWEASLYASLCNFKGFHNLDFWKNANEQLEKIYISTVKYIYSLDLEEEKMNAEMSKCLEIIKKDIISSINMYFEYKDGFDEACANYIYALQNSIFNLYLTLKDIKLNQIHKFSIDFSNTLLELISKTNKITSKITKENLNELIENHQGKIDMDYDVIYEKCNVNDLINNLSSDEIKEIKLNGIMYFEYKDKVVSKRIFLKNLIFGILIIAFSIIGTVCCIISNLVYCFAFIIPLLYGLLLVLRAFIFKDKIKCSSYLSVERIINRLSSNGNVVTENEINPINVLLNVVIFIQIVISAFLISMLIYQYMDNNLGENLNIIIAGFVIISSLLSFILTLTNSNSYMSTTYGRFYYNYKDKIYQF